MVRRHCDAESSRKLDAHPRLPQPIEPMQDAPRSHAEVLSLTVTECSSSEGPDDLQLYPLKVGTIPALAGLE